MTTTSRSSVNTSSFFRVREVFKKIVDAFKIYLSWVLCIFIIPPLWLLLAITPVLRIINKKVFRPIFGFFSNYGLLILTIISNFFLGLYICFLVDASFVVLLIYIFVALLITIYSAWNHKDDLARRKLDLELATPIIFEEIRNRTFEMIRCSTLTNAMPNIFYDQEMISDIVNHEFSRLFEAKYHEKKAIDDEWFELLGNTIANRNKIIKQEHEKQNPPPPPQTKLSRSLEVAFLAGLIVVLFVVIFVHNDLIQYF
jgi:hypothetical protein